MFGTVLLTTFREHLRHRLYQSLFLFGFMMLGGGLVVSALAAAERGRLLLDLGLSAVEFLGLTTIVFISVNLILAEIETRTIYLVLSRPVPRGLYVAARFGGTVLAVAASMLVMGLMHGGLMLLFPETVSPGAYALAWLCSVAKLAVVGALALALSLFATSATTAMTFTVFLWAIGHFSQELRFVGEKSDSPLVQGLVWVFYHAAPNFAFFNYRDFLYAPTLPGLEWFGWMAGYTILYVAVCLWLATLFFNEREV